jgi:hypothetical protein
MSLSLRSILLAAAVSALWAPAALAREPAEHAQCAAVSDAALPPALAGWTRRISLAAAADAAGAAKAPLPIGRGVDARLRRSGEVSFPVLPQKPGGSVSYGGLFELSIAETGDYQVSLATGAWIEVVRDGAAVESTAHAPGPACSTLKKTVIFPLTPGRYLLEVTGNGEPALALMVTRVVR